MKPNVKIPLSSTEEIMIFDVESVRMDADKKEITFIGRHNNYSLEYDSIEELVMAYHFAVYEIARIQEKEFDEKDGMLKEHVVNMPTRDELKIGLGMLSFMSDVMSLKDDDDESDDDCD